MNNIVLDIVKFFSGSINNVFVSINAPISTFDSDVIGEYQIIKRDYSLNVQVELNGDETYM